MGKPSALVQGTLDLLILRAVEYEPKHGWAIAKHIGRISNDVLIVQQGSLYPALYRLHRERLIAGDWRTTETGREAKFYSLTDAGRMRLKREVAAWERLSGAINLVIQRA